MKINNLIFGALALIAAAVSSSKAEACSTACLGSNVVYCYDVGDGSDDYCDGGDMWDPGCAFFGSAWFGGGCDSSF